MKIFLLWVTLLVLPAVAAVEVAPDQFELVEVTFTGVESVPKSELARTLIAQTPPFWKFWRSSPVLSAQDLEDDRLRIQQFYRDNGSYQTVAGFTVTVSGPAPVRGISVPPQSQKITGPGEPPSGALPRVSVTFEITEGPPVLIESIDMTGHPERRRPDASPCRIRDRDRW